MRLRIGASGRYGAKRAAPLAAARPSWWLDDVVHARHLLGHRGGQLRRLVQRSAQHGQRRLQAVGEETQRFLVAGLAHTLLLDQGVEVVGERRDFGGVASLHLGLLAVLDAPDLMRHARQRRQAPLQQNGLRQQQQHRRPAEPGPQGAREDADLAVELRLVFQHRKNQRRLGRASGPVDAIGGREEVAACAMHGVIVPLADRQAALERRADADRGRRLPLFTPVDVDDLCVQAGARAATGAAPGMPRA